MRIAFFTLLSPLRSALADCGEGLAVGMSDVPGTSIDLFIDDGYQPDNPAITERFNIYSYRDFEARAGQYDAYVYSMGDHAGYHQYMLDLLHAYPGVVIMHDLTFHHCIAHSMLSKGNVQGYLDELQYSYGLRDLRLARHVEAGLGDKLVLRYPLFERIARDSLGVIVHNQYARQRVLASCPQTRVACIPYPFFMPPGFPDYNLKDQQAKRRAELGLQDHFVVGSFGILVPNKHLEASLTAFSRVVRKHPQSKYILGGFAMEGYDLAGQIIDMGLEDHVILTGWLPVPEFARYMFALDVGIHLRHPHIGGTPYTPFRLMGLGVCTIVSDIEPLAEVPQGACIKIAPDEYQEETLCAMLEYLAEQPAFRRQVSDNGREFVTRHHSLEGIARQYVQFIQDSRQN